MSRRLIAALQQIVGRLNAVIADLEDGKLDRAADELSSMRADWKAAMEELA